MLQDHYGFKVHLEMTSQISHNPHLIDEYVRFDHMQYDNTDTKQCGGTNQFEAMIYDPHRYSEVDK